MPKINKYIDFTINTNNTFYIVESSSKPKSHDSAKATLAKIEFIVKNNLIYDPNHHDAYSTQPQYRLSELLKAQSSRIHKGYQKKQSKLHWIIRKFFSKEKQIFATHKRILNYIKSSQVLPLPNKIIEKITGYLEVPELKAFAQLNRHGEAHAEAAIIKKAKKFGYEERARRFRYECKNSVNAFKYMHDLIKDTDKLIEEKVIPEKCSLYKTEKIGSERVLQNLNTLSCYEAFPLLTSIKIADKSAFYNFLYHRFL